jgi:hypothetical protein
MVNQPSLSASSHYLRPIALQTTQCNNGTIGDIELPGNRRHRLVSGCHCKVQGTSPLALVSNLMSGRRLGNSRQPAEPSGRTRRLARKANRVRLG